MTEVPYASAAEIAVKAIEAFLPPEVQTVADHALEHRLLANTGGGYVGRFSHDLTPYMVEPMERLTDPNMQTVAIAGPGQSAKTVVAENWMLYSVDVEPANILWYMQTDEAVEAYVKGTINPMIDQHDELRNRLGLRPVDDSLHFKRFRSMTVEFLSATLRTMINKKAPRIVADEIDAYAPGLGDVKALLDVRRQTFGPRSKLLMMSHPDMARGVNPETDWTAGIMAVYADSDRCVWYWPCPHCGGWSSPAPTATRVMTIDYPEEGTLDEIERAARLACPINGCLIEDHERAAMNRVGKWVGTGETIDEDGVVEGERVRHRVAGYWILGAMSQFIMGGIGGLARARVKAEREKEISGDDGTLRQVIVKQWGIPYAPQRGVGTVQAADLIDRCDGSLKLGVVPDGVRFLSTVVDIQASHFEWLTRGWGVHGESWVIARGKLLAEPATSADDWDRLLDDVLLQVYPLADGSGRVMVPRCMGFDSGGLPGVTQQAYTAWRRWRKKKTTQRDGSSGSPVRLYGRISDREAWNILPLKGATGINAPKLTVTYPDTQRKASAAARRTVPIGIFNPNLFKDDLAGQLMNGEPGPWYVHLPSALKSKEPPHVWFEQLVSEAPGKSGRWEKIQPTAKNEALDLMVMSHVVAHLHGLSRIDWDRPPAWAAEWDDNSFVVAAEDTEPVPPSDGGGGVRIKSVDKPKEPRAGVVRKLAH